ncbi:hypothetical protein QBC32DRAFT_110314 [Pseudoneurospora amorphoporcata]|uniref:Uncharacterized protein n=1 Tax=Pseudoneurospora amorphoporcata TaxID=241081 RepID=A0AAN6P2T3_9PEZI|nr:hypothetical protein QBC32DRAFT_110314 [Pseudoneurospora amorphoporcata]
MFFFSSFYLPFFCCFPVCLVACFAFSLSFSYPVFFFFALGFRKVFRSSRASYTVGADLWRLCFICTFMPTCPLQEVPEGYAETAESRERRRKEGTHETVSSMKNQPLFPRYLPRRTSLGAGEFGDAQVEAHSHEVRARTLLPRLLQAVKHRHHCSEYLRIPSAAVHA